MSTLVAITYPDHATAQQALAQIAQLQKGGLISLEDAVIVTKDAHGKVKLNQSNGLTSAGAASGALWGMLFGLLFFVPVFGLVVGATMGGLAGKMSDIGIDDKFMKDLAASMVPGSAVLFLLVIKATADKVVPEVAKFGGTLLHTSLSKEVEAQLKAALEAGGPVPTSAEAAPDAPPAAT